MALNFRLRHTYLLNFFKCREEKILIIFFVIFTLMLISFSFYTYQMVNTPNILVDQPDRIFIIPRGSTFGDIQARLYDGNYVNEAVSFGVLARLMDYDESVKPGRYLLKSNMSNLATLRMLRSGQQAPVNVTFNNIRIKKELAEKICSEVSANPDEFLALLNDTAVVRRIRFYDRKYYVHVYPQYLPGILDDF